MHTLSDLSLSGKRVLVRVDFNVPLDGTTITDDTRIRGALPTIRHILDEGGLPILMSHLGRPGGSPNPDLSLRPVADHLQALLRTNHPDAEVVFCEQTVGDDARSCLNAASAGSVVLLENTRFLPGEKQNDPETAKQLAALGDVFVADAFGSAHRAHASTVGVAEHVETTAAGFLMERELTTLRRALNAPPHPFVVVLGGAKVSDKIGVIKNLMPKVDRILIGGAMAYTFLKALGHRVGSSRVETDRLDEAFRLRDDAPDIFALPDDHVIADAFTADAETRTVVGAIPDGWMGLDIGPATRDVFGSVIEGAGMIIWNGPMGVFEMEPFANGTRAVAEAVARATRDGATSIVGGGDSVAAITEAGFEEHVTHVSTGGGAMLELLEGKTLPGVAALG